VSNFDWTGCLAGCEERWWPGGRGVEMVTRDFMGPLGGIWSKLSRKRVTGWNDNIHVTFCTNYAVCEWVLDNKRSLVPAGRVKTNKQTNNKFNLILTNFFFFQKNTNFLIFFFLVKIFGPHLGYLVPRVEGSAAHAANSLLVFEDHQDCWLGQ
jgi:hypothetical protein